MHKVTQNNGNLSYIYFSIFSMLLFLLLSCDGGGNNIIKVYSPSIGNLSLSPNTVNQYDGDGLQPINYSFDFTDGGGDLSSVTVVVFNSQEVQVGGGTVTLQNMSGIKSGHLNLTINVDTTIAGIYTLEFYVTDKIGFMSNRITGIITIVKSTVFARAVKYSNDISTLNLADTAIGDLNGDGRNDVVVIEGGNASSRILVYYQNAQGTLDKLELIATDISLRGVAIADVNNDGLADLIVNGMPSAGTAAIDVFKQNPATHNLDAPIRYALPTSTVTKLAVADLNNDGLLDIITPSPNTTNGKLHILFQGAGGVLTLQTIVLNSAIDSGSEVHVADMNSDGLNDIIIQSGFLQLAVIKQTTPGVFNNTPDFYTVHTSYWPRFYSFALGDLNGDGRIDIAVADPGNMPLLNIFYQNTDGVLTGPTMLPFAITTNDEVDIADLNGDGLNDIIILCGGNGVNIYYQTLDHNFSSAVLYRLPTLSTGGTAFHQVLTVGDVTSDGLPDIVASWSNEGIFVLRRLP